MALGNSAGWFIGSVDFVEPISRNFPRCLRGRTTYAKPFGIMQKVNFDEAVSEIIESDSRYQRDSYSFVRDALDFTLKRRRSDPNSGDLIDRHVGGEELMDGFREFALKEFGPMVTTVLDEWGVRRCEDVGNIVFNLIDAGIFGKAEDDSIEDFCDCYDFGDAFVEPFLPKHRPSEEDEISAAEEPPVNSCDS